MYLVREVIETEISLRLRPFNVDGMCLGPYEKDEQYQQSLTAGHRIVAEATGDALKQPSRLLPSVP